MGDSGSCVQFSRKGKIVSVVNTHYPERGPVTNMDHLTYTERFKKVLETHNPADMFEKAEEYSSFSPGEMEALLDYILHPDGGLPDQLDDGQTVTAFEHRRDLPKKE